MSIRYDASTVYCEAECMVEEALPLLEYLRTHEGVRIDMTGCAYVHAAVLQVLAAAAPGDLALPASPALERWAGAVMRARSA
jgi:hypothetical protein